MSTKLYTVIDNYDCVGNNYQVTAACFTTRELRDKYMAEYSKLNFLARAGPLLALNPSPPNTVPVMFLRKWRGNKEIFVSHSYEGSLRDQKMSFIRYIHGIVHKENIAADFFVSGNNEALAISAVSGICLKLTTRGLWGNEEAARELVTNTKQRRCNGKHGIYGKQW